MMLSRRAAIVAMALLVGAWTPARAEAPQYGGTLNVGMDDDASSLDPTFQTQFSERQPEYLIFNTLFGLKSDLSIVPELADSWWFSKDGLTLTLHLRRGVKFHDATDFNADAVKWNLDHRLNDEVNSPSRRDLKRSILAVEAVDPLTVRIRLKTASPSLLGMLAQREGFMASPTAARKYGDRFGFHPVGTGPFVFKTWLRNDRIVVERNPNYWDHGKPYLDRVVFHLLENSTVAVPRILTGELDAVSYLSPNQVLPLRGKPGVQLIVNPRARWVSLSLNNAHRPFNDLRVRQAIAYGLDRQKIAAIATAGKGVVANGLTPPGLWWFDKDLMAYPHDPAMAKKLLVQAGYGAGLSLTLSTPPDSLYRPVSALVQEQLQEVGIKVRIEPVSASMWGERLMNGEIDFLPMRYTQRPDPDGLLSSLLEGSSAQNMVKFRNAEFDALLLKGRAEKDQNRRREIYNRAQEIIAEQLPYINLFFSVEYTALRSGVQNYIFVPDDIPRYREVWKSRGTH